MKGVAKEPRHLQTTGDGLGLLSHHSFNCSRALLRGGHRALYQDDFRVPADVFNVGSMSSLGLPEIWTVA